MKKAVVALTMLAAAICGARAGIILSDNFIYSNGTVSNGVLTTISGGTWYAHSAGGSVPIQVINGRAQITSGSGSREDDSLDMAGAPYATNSGVILYSSYSLVVSNTAGISAAGGYITHFKDASTGTSFHGRVFLSTSNYTAATAADPGTYLIGIGNGSLANASSGQLTNVLVTNVVYTVVTRCDLGNNQASTIWINPNSETDYSVTATDANGASNQLAMSSYAFRQGAAGAGTNYVGNLKVGTVFADVAGANTSPTISSIADQAIPRNGTTGPLSFTVNDAESPAGSLIVTASSGNTTLVPNTVSHLSAGGSGANRTVTVTPELNQQGKATITVNVSDTVNTSFTMFDVTVGSPTISAIADQTAVTNTPIPAILFTATDPESDPLTFSASSSNTNLITANNIVFGSSGSSSNVTLTPVAGQLGVSIITIFVTDGHTTNSTSFRLVMRPLLGVLYDEDFAYTNFDNPNALYLATGGSGAPWHHISGPLEELQVTNGLAYLVHTNNEDLGAALVGGPYFGSNGVVFYTSFPATFSLLPSTAGDYLFHLADSGTDTTNFRDKLFAARPSGTAAGSFRLGVANQANGSPAYFPQDLSTGTTYTVVMRYNSGSGESVLWVNPRAEGSVNAAAHDTSGTSTIGGVGLRQPGSGIGDLSIGHLKVGTSFTDVATVVPAPTREALHAQLDGSNLILTWTKPAFLLAASASAPGPYVTIPGSSSPYTNALTSTAQFFRLVYP
jgi:hypothetical protein